MFNLNPRTLISQIQGLLATLAMFISVAEGLFVGTKLGASRKDWVLDQLMPLLATHLGPFWKSPLARAVASMLIDSLVAVANKQGVL